MVEEEKCQTLSFHIRLLMRMEGINDYPFTKMVIKKGLTGKEYEETFLMLEELQQKFELFKEEGMVYHLPLLLHFVGMLNYKLNPHETMHALEKEGYYQELMQTFIKNNKK